jgi:hypothetical protein
MRIVSVLGTTFGVIAGLCFMGVGFTPANVSGLAHGSFVLAAYMVLITQRRQIPGVSQVLIQATGQKIIVYASLASILLQSVAAQRAARLYDSPR